MPAAWAAYLLFFRLVPLVGYSYAHLCVRWLSLRQWAILHLGVLAASLLLLPIEPNPARRTTGGENPNWSILALLIATIGGPYFVLSSTAPLLQSWFGATPPNARPTGSTPYRIWAQCWHC